MTEPVFGKEDLLATEAFLRSEMRKTLAGSIAFKTDRGGDDFTLEVFMPDMQAARKAANLWKGLSGEPHEPVFYDQPGHHQRRPVYAFYFEDMGAHSNKDSGARFLEAAGSSLEVISVTADGAGQSHNPETMESPAARDYAAANARFETALHMMGSLKQRT